MKKFVCGGMLALALCASIRAETLNHAPTGLHLNVPAGWEQKADGDLLVLNNPADDVVVLVFVGTDGTGKDFVLHVVKELEHLVKNPHVTKGPQTEKVNNLTQDYIEGTGTLLEADKWIPKGEKSGETVDWDLTLATGGKEPLVIVAFGKLHDNQKILSAIYASIKK